MRRFACIASGALVLLAAAAGCGGYVKARPVVLEPRALTFLESRAEAPSVTAVSTDPNEPAPHTQTIELVGAVARPGIVAIEDGLRTVSQALEAVGGPIAAANTLRIRPANDVVAKLFADDGGGSTPVEIPLSAIAEKPLYLHPGDVIEVAVSEPSHPAENAPIATASPAAEAAAASAPVLAAPMPEPVVQPLPAGEPAPAAAAVVKVEPPKPTLADDAGLRLELARVRAEFEGKLASMRAEIDKLHQDQARLLARLERPAAAAAPAPVATKAPAAKSADVAGAEKPVPAEKPAASAEKAAAGTRPTTVLVSGSVRSPGVYSIDDVKTVRGAVRAAGDRADANLAAVEIRPDGQRGALVGMGLGLGTAPTRTVVNLVASDVPLRGGEVIFVPASVRTEQAR